MYGKKKSRHSMAAGMRQRQLYLDCVMCTMTHIHSLYLLFAYAETVHTASFKGHNRWKKEEMHNKSTKK